MFAFILGLFVSIGIERWVKPRPTLVKRAIAAIFLHIATFALIYSIFLLLSKRPIFSALATLVTQIIFIVINNAKVVALREPLVFSDLVLFTQAIKHPRLYLPFLGLIPAIATPVLIVLAIVVCTTLEAASFDYSLGVFTQITLLIIALLLLIRHFAAKLKLSLCPTTDVKTYGLITSLVAYIVQAQKDNESVIFKFESKPHTVTNKPHIIAIQSESFFDARALHPTVKQSLLKSFDRCTKQALFTGRLEVPVWGANTMRTEFAFLTASANEILGFKRFDPYQAYCGETVATLASHLKTEGYRCVCIHPHPATFFKRDQLFPNMGFDEFIDIAAFDETQKSGPYIGDIAVAEKVLEVLNQADSPVFIFAITMENHGPLHLETIGPEDEARLYHTTPPSEFHDLSVFLRHLVNADAMIKHITTTLEQQQSDTLFCLFGDHVPSMPKVYDKLNFSDAMTPYFIWQAGHNQSIQQDIKVEDLAEQLLACRQ